MKDPNTNFRNTTRRTVDFLYLIVILLLPVIWLGDYKNLISLLFKTIRSNEPRFVQISQSQQMGIITLGLITYILHRYFRCKEHTLRYETLKRENSLVDTCDHQEVKIKLLKEINELIEMQDAEWELAYEFNRKGEVSTALDCERKSATGEGTDSSTRQTKASPKPKARRSGIFRKSLSDVERSKHSRSQL